MFYALGRNRVPVVVSVAAVAVNVAASLGLVGTLGFRGLALSTSLAALVHGAALLVVLRGALGGLHGRRLTATLVKSAAASAAMAGAALAAHAWLTQTDSGSKHVGPGDHARARDRGWCGRAGRDGQNPADRGIR